MTHRIITLMTFALMVVALITVMGLPRPAAADATLDGTFIDYLGVGNDGVLINSVGQSMRFSPTGVAPFSSDVYAPGSPIELFALEATDDTGNFVVANNSFPFEPDLIPTVAGGETQAVGREIHWTGRYTAAGRQVRLRQSFFFPSAACYAQLTVEITNEGSLPLRDLHFLRGGDPDQGIDSTGSATANDVLRQPPGSVAALVASGAGGAPGIASSLGIGSYDGRARVFVTDLPQTEAPRPAGMWLNPADPNGANADLFVGIVFRLDRLEPAATVRLTYFYLWGSDTSQVEQCFASVLCQGSAPLTPCEADGLFCSLDACDANGGTPAGLCVQTGAVSCTSAGACVQSGTCDEDLNRCVYTLAPDTCAIDNACFAAGDLRDGSAATCQICDPARSIVDWSPVLTDPMQCPGLPPGGDAGAGDDGGGAGNDAGSPDGGDGGDEETGGDDRTPEISGDSYFCQSGPRPQGVGTWLGIVLPLLGRRRRRNQPRICCMRAR